jgi:hypothetical protein
VALPGDSHIFIGKSDVYDFSLCSFIFGGPETASHHTLYGIPLAERPEGTAQKQDATVP